MDCDFCCCLNDIKYHNHNIFLTKEYKLYFYDKIKN